ncbi:hypothetical protein [Methylobacillus glycogenes]|uniref:hypothetical protein n=1 Tax=Methylobacillus glycogenes TaxID=406 RepID=UPI000471883F|nr:hypothetical protein [Methylobacillus glycogenes]
MSKSIIQLAAVLAVVSTVSGCATITKDAYQNIQIETYSADNKPVKGIECVARNDRGEWKTYTPGSLNVHRSGENLSVRCAVDGQLDGNGTVVSRANGGMYGNIIFGGGIGAIIDHNKGTAYSYPGWIKVQMGENLVYDRKDEVENQILLGKKSDGTVVKEVTTAKTATAENAAK